MKCLLVPAILFASCASFASAKDVEVEVEVKKEKAQEAARKSARVIIIQTDGKKHEFPLGKGKVDEKVLKGLPKNIQIRIRKVIEENAGKGKRKIETTVRTKGKVVIVGPDGKRREIEFDGEDVDEKVLKELPRNIRVRIESALKGQPGKGADVKRRIIKKSQGRAIIIGPDGKKQEFKFGGDTPVKKGMLPKGLPNEVRERLLKALKAHGGKGSFDLGGKRIGVFIGPDGKKHEFRFDTPHLHLKGGALDKLPKEAREQLLKSIKGTIHLRQSHAAKSKAGGSQSDKLDLILKRLDSLEKQIQELRKKVNR